MPAASAMPVVTRRDARPPSPPPAPPPPPPAPPCGGGAHWTPALDAQLAAAVALHGFVPAAGQVTAYWRHVAASMGLFEADLPKGARRCQRRWAYVKPGNEHKVEATRAYGRCRMKHKRLLSQLFAVDADWEAGLPPSEPPPPMPVLECLELDELPDLPEPESEPEPESPPAPAPKSGPAPDFAPVTVAKVPPCAAADAPPAVFYRFGMFRLGGATLSITYDSWKCNRTRLTSVLRRQARAQQELQPPATIPPLSPPTTTTPTPPPRPLSEQGQPPPLALPPSLLPLPPPQPRSLLAAPPPPAAPAPSPPPAAPAAPPPPQRLRVQGKVTDFMVISKRDAPRSSIYKHTRRRSLEAELRAVRCAEPPLE